MSMPLLNMHCHAVCPGRHQDSLFIDADMQRHGALGVGAQLTHSGGIDR
jgi:hypothetical protein